MVEDRKVTSGLHFGYLPGASPPKKQRFSRPLFPPNFGGKSTGDDDRIVRDDRIVPDGDGFYNPSTPPPPPGHLYSGLPFPTTPVFGTPSPYPVTGAYLPTLSYSSSLSSPFGSVSIPPSVILPTRQRTPSQLCTDTTVILDPTEIKVILFFTAEISWDSV